MENRHIAFSPPDITEEEIAEVADTLRSGWITTGPKTKKFENEIAAFCHTSKAVCLNSATACAEMSLRVLGIGPGDEVITSAYTYTASASVAVHVKHSGEIADFTSFSFHAVKNLTTAEGGAAVWRDIDGIDNEEIYKQFMLLSLHGQSKDALAKTQLGAWEYDIIAPYYKCNMTDIMASLGLVQLRRYPSILARRKEIIEKYNEGLKDLDLSVLNHYGDDFASSGHLYLVRLNGKTREECNAVITKMAEAGVATNVHYKPLPLLTAYKNLGFDIKDYPNAYALFENEITLPLHTKLTDEDVEYVIETFRKCVSEV